MDTDDLPPEEPVTTLFTEPECGCVLLVERASRPTPQGVYIHVIVRDILHRCSCHDDQRHWVHGNDINKEKEYFAEIVKYHETHQ